MEAARRLGVDRTTMVALVDALEGKGLVERRRSEEDRRRNVVELTERGRRVRADAEEAREAAEREFLAPLGEKDAAQLVTALRMLIRTWSRPEDPRSVPSGRRSSAPRDLLPAGSTRKGQPARTGIPGLQAR